VVVHFLWEDEMNQRFSLFLTMSLIVLLIGAGGATAQGSLPETPSTPLGTAFTYQGRLIDNGSPGSVAYDFRFILYNSENGGSQVGNTVLKDDIEATDGYFTVLLDFGAGVFVMGPKNWT
jgi:hypothetical protein